MATICLMLALAAAACTAPEPTAVPATSKPTDTPSPAAAATVAPSTPTPTATATPEPTPSSTPPPTYTPAPTFTPKPRPTATLRPAPTSTPGPTRTPRPTSTPRPTHTPTSLPTATRKPTPVPTPHFREIPTAMLIYESKDNPFWIMYPGGCHALQPVGDWLRNDRRCTLNTLIAVSVREWPPNSGRQDTVEFVDRAVDNWKQDSEIQSVRCDSITTHQGREVELIRNEFEYSDGESGTGVSAFYVHDDGSLFRINFHYATKLKSDNAPIVDFALKSFTVLE